MAGLGSENKIMEEILQTHAPCDATKLDVKSLLNIVTNILNGATHIVDGVVKGTQEHLEKVEDKTYWLDFKAPCTVIGKVSCEMMCSCQAGDPEKLKETTLSVFKKLSGYSWDAKVVVALSAYAMNYGDLWVVKQIYQQHQLVMPMAVLKGLTVLDKPTGKLKDRIVAINQLTKTILKVTECIAKIEMLWVNNNPVDVPALAKATDYLPKAVYYTINTVIACASQINSLTTTTDHESHTNFILNTLEPKLKTTSEMLDEFLYDFKASIGENERYQMLLKLKFTRTDNIEVLKAITDSKSDMLVDLSTNTTVEMNILRRKHVVLVISGLDMSITQRVIDSLEKVYVSCKSVHNNKYPFVVVWVPVVEQWDSEAKKRFHPVKAGEMPLYTVDNFWTKIDSAVLRFYRQEWAYQGKPIAPVISGQGNFESRNALPAITLWGTHAFPFTLKRQTELWEKHAQIISMDLIMGDTHPDVPIWIKNKQFLLLCGGTGKDWIESTLRVRANSFFGKIKRTFKLVNLNEHTGFWNRIESLLLLKMERQEVDEAFHKIMELFWYRKNEKWAVMCMGSKVFISGHGDSIVDVLSRDPSNWKVEEPAQWVNALQEVTALDLKCFHYRIPATSGWVPGTVKCLKCSRLMERFISFECCHKDKDAPNNGSPC